MKEESYNNKAIDLWSVGVILHEMFFQKIPMTYSKSFATDIYRGWKMPDEFSIFPNLYKKSGMGLLSLVVSLISQRAICVKQSERL